MTSLSEMPGGACGVRMDAGEIVERETDARCFAA